MEILMALLVNPTAHINSGREHAGLPSLGYTANREILQYGASSMIGCLSIFGTHSTKIAEHLVMDSA
jgi:hypothetical protein